MLLAVQDGLIQMGDAPSLRDVEPEQLRQLVRRFLGDGIAPGAERDHQLILLIEGHVAVHHRADADGRKGVNLCTVLLFNFFCKRGVAVRQPGGDVLHRVGPDAVRQTVLPVVRADGQHGTVRIDEDSLDSCRAEFNPENCFSGFNDFLCCHDRPPVFFPIV